MNQILCLLKNQQWLSTATPIIIPDKKPTEPGEPVIQDETWWFSESIPESIKAEL